MARNLVPPDDDLTKTLGTKLKRWITGFFGKLDVASGSCAPVNTLQRGTAYAVGDVVTSDKLNAKFRLVCTTAGTTGETEPDMTGVASGSTVTDGTAVWKVKTIVSAEDVNAAVPPSVGSAVKPVYSNSNGVITASDGNVGSAVKPVYMSNGEITVSNGNVGSSKKLIYMDGGEFKESTENLGSKVKIIYIAGGEIKESDQNLGAEDQALFLQSGVFTAGGKFVPVQNNAGFHNSVFRGKYLGASLTAAQSAAIQAGTFEDMFIGDYWEIPVSFAYYKATTDATAQSGKTYYADTAGTALASQPAAGTNISNSGYCEKVSVSNQSVIWRIAGFDYWYNVGDTNFATHHVVIVPDSALYNAQMHITNTGGYVSGSAANTTEGGYQATDLFKGLVGAQAAAEAAFGAAHVPSHKVLLPTTCTGGKYTGGGWASRKVDIMTEVMVYGARAWGAPANNGYSVASQDSQLPLFHLAPEKRHTRYSYWLQDVSSASYFAIVYGNGTAYYLSASNSYGVRPAFALI